MPINEALEHTANILLGIMVPVGLTDMIAEPISRAVSNIREVQKALTQAPPAEETPAEEEPAIREEDL